MTDTKTVSSADNYGYMLEAAVRYSGRNLRVLPLWGISNGACTCGSAQCTAPGKHPRIRDWPTNASSQLGVMRVWLRQWREMNMGIATGEESGIFVIDVDGPEGERSLTQLIARYGELGDTLTVKTSRGRHLYFRHPGRRVKTTASVLGEKLDVRGDRGYVVAPPSVHVSGAEYAFVDRNAPVAKASEWLIGLVCGDAQIVQPPAEANGDAAINEGSRNQTLFEHGCGMRGGGASQAEIENELMEKNDQACQPPLEASEVKQIAESAAKYSPNSVRKSTAITGGECNLRWFPLDTTAWRRNEHVFAMRDCQVGWYIWLIVECWDRGGSLPSDPTLLAKLARASSPKRFAKEMPTVLAEFELSDDESALIHPALVAEYAARAEKVEKKRQAGQERWKKAKTEPTPQAG